MQSVRELEESNNVSLSRGSGKRTVKLNPINRQRGSKGFDYLNLSNQTLNMNNEILNETVATLLPKRTNRQNLGSITEASKLSQAKSQSGI